MKNGRWLTLTVALAALAFAAVAAPEAALAKTSDVGKNLGEEIRGFAAAILLALAAIFGLSAMKDRNFASAITVFGIAVVIGSFIFAQNDVVKVIRALARSVAP